MNRLESKINRTAGIEAGHQATMCSTGKIEGPNHHQFSVPLHCDLANHGI